MSALNWQKSSYSGQGANCINVAAADKGSVKLRESDVPARSSPPHPRASAPSSPVSKQAGSTVEQEAS
ncbi:MULTISPECIES: DUF397 domain-containing protein [unclassified Streptomyces]|uniref:DUF397 domain-containing protein n=1 Tax=unclassified Streptomyces TaxID=2593676 RepID=UPI0037F947B0